MEMENTTVDVVNHTMYSPDVTQPSIDLQGPEGLAKVPGCQLYKFVLSFCINGVLCIFGIGGNALSMVVLQKMKSRSRAISSATILMMALLVTDILVLVTLAAMKSIPALCTFTKICNGFFTIYPYYLVWGWPLATTAHALGTWMTMLLTIHRYIAVCHPHKAAIWGKPNQVTTHIILFTIFTVLFELPIFLNDYVEKRLDPDTNLTRIYWEKRAFHYGMGYNLVYKIILYYLVIYAVPLATISIMTFFLLRTLKRSRKFRQQMSQHVDQGQHAGRSSKEDDLNVILLSIVFLYLFTQIWEPIRRIIEEFDEDKTPKCGEFRYYFDEIPTLMAIISSSMNFVIYCASGKRIRDILKGMFSYCFAKRSSESENDQSTIAVTGSVYPRVSELSTTTTMSVSMITVKDG